MQDHEARLPLATHRSYPVCARFDRFHLDLSRGELRKEGVTIAIQELPIRVLRMLLQAEGEVVTREQLRAELWPKDGSGLLWIRLSSLCSRWHTRAMPKRISKTPQDINQAAFQMVRRLTDTEDAPVKAPAKVSTSDISRVMAAMGRRGGQIGGKRRLTTMTPEERREAARKAAHARWEKRADKLPIPFSDTNPRVEAFNAVMKKQRLRKVN